MPMKLLYITYGLSSGGAERFLTDLLNELSDKPDLEITLLLLKSTKIDGNLFYAEELSKRVTIKSLGLYKINLSVFGKLYAAVKKEQPDIVHINLSPIILYCIFPILFYRKPIYIETLHNEVARIDNGNKIKFFLKSFLYRSGLAKICCISDKNAYEYKRVYRKNCDALIYNGRKALHKTQAFDHVCNEVESYKPNKNAIVITHIARCAKQKNQRLLIEAFNELTLSYPDAILLIIGSNFDSVEGKELQQLACDNIFFLGIKHNIQDYLFCSDAFCLSSIYEGMPITLIEALSCGCVPLSTPVSGVVDIVKDGVNGFISENFTKASFVEMLHRYIANRQSIDRNKLMMLFENKLSIRSCAKSYLEFYTRCLH